MANVKSARKRARRSERRTQVNGARRNRIRTYVKKVEAALAVDDGAAARQTLAEAEPELMRGASKGVLHRNTAARTVSRLAARVKSLG